VEETSYFTLLNRMGDYLMQEGCIDEDFLTNVFHREKLLSFAAHPSYILVHSPVAAPKTRILITTLNHRIRVKDNKIRTVIMVCTRPEDRGLVFKLLNELYRTSFNPNDTRYFKTKVEYLNFFRKHLKED